MDATAATTRTRTTTTTATATTTTTTSRPPSTITNAATPAPDSSARLPSEQNANEEPHLIRSRVANACDGCKARKVKCDGKLPCSYCTRRQRPHTCKYSPPRQRRHPRPRTQPRTPSLASPSASHHGASDQGAVRLKRHQHHPGTTVASAHRGSQPDDDNIINSTLPVPSPVKPATPLPRQRGSSGRDGGGGGGGGDDDDGDDDDNNHHHPAITSPEDHEEAEVPREARLLCDAQGKLIFIGDCAPLSFFQTVRQLVTSRVDPNAFAPQTSRYSVLENATSRSSLASGLAAPAPPAVDLDDIPGAVAAYLSVTSGMVDLFVSEARLAEDIALWASNSLAGGHRADDVASAVNYLVLALGTQRADEGRAQLYFEHARDHALATLNGSLSIETVQAFILVTLYMLCACQINGAFLFFGLAVRAAYSIGVHRTEVNSRFGHELHRRRDRIWKSLRIVDLFLSTSMGRPPCVSDVDCTVPYRQVDAHGHELYDILNASVQIFLILEGIVLEVYSRRKITFQLTEGISRQLRDFSVRWLHQLKRVVSSPSSSSSSSSSAAAAATDGGDSAEVNGACQVLATYYYAVMLVSRPFLMYELYRRLSPEPTTIYGRAGLVSGKSKLADACIDAASLMVDQVLDLIEKGSVTGRRPILVSWLFAGSLVLGAGLLGNFGRVLEKYARMSMTALDYFAKIDTHAAQYAMISKSLLTTALEYLEKKEVQERLQRTESSAQLFGLLPHGPRDADSAAVARRSPELTRKVASPLAMGNKERDMSHGELMSDSHHHHPYHSHHPTGSSSFGAGSPFFGDLDPTFLTMSNNLSRSPDLSLMNTVFDGDESSFGGLNLFPLLETGGGGGHIDLANYL